MRLLGGGCLCTRAYTRNHNTDAGAKAPPPERSPGTFPGQLFPESWGWIYKNITTDGKLLEPLPLGRYTHLGRSQQGGDGSRHWLFEGQSAELRAGLTPALAWVSPSFIFTKFAIRSAQRCHPRRAHLRMRNMQVTSSFGP